MISPSFLYNKNNNYLIRTFSSADYLPLNGWDVVWSTLSCINYNITYTSVYVLRSVTNTTVAVVVSRKYTHHGTCIRYLQRPTTRVGNLYGVHRPRFAHEFVNHDKRQQALLYLHSYGKTTEA